MLKTSLYNHKAAASGSLPLVPNIVYRSIFWLLRKRGQPITSTVNTMDKILAAIKQEYGKRFYTLPILEQMHIIKSVSENFIGAIEFIKKVKQ